MRQAIKSHEPKQSIVEQRLHGNDNGNVQIGYMKSIEPKIFDKKTRGYIKKCNLSPNC